MPEGSLFIKGGRVVDPANHYDETGNILIENGSVRAVGRQVEADPGTPKAMVGTRAPPSFALLELSEAMTPRTSPAPKLS